MTFSFNTYQLAHTILSKTMKLIGKHIVEIGIATCAGVSLLASKKIYDAATVEGTKYIYRGWELYKKDELYYAMNGNKSIASTVGFEHLKEMIDLDDDNR